MGQASLQECTLSLPHVLPPQHVPTPVFHLLGIKACLLFGRLWATKTTAVLCISWTWPGPSLTLLNIGINQARLAAELTLAQLRRQFGPRGVALSKGQ